MDSEGGAGICTGLRLDCTHVHMRYWSRHMWRAVVTGAGARRLASTTVPWRQLLPQAAHLTHAAGSSSTSGPPTSATSKAEVTTLHSSRA